MNEFYLCKRQSAYLLASSKHSTLKTSEKTSTELKSKVKIIFLVIKSHKRLMVCNLKFDIHCHYYLLIFLSVYTICVMSGDCWFFY